IADQRIAAVTITGSERAGRSVAALAGGALKPIVLELGGSDPFIVLADADVALAATTGATARTMNTGQSCICAKRFIVEDAVHNAFVAQLTEALRNIRIGNPGDPTTQIGPMARRDLRDGLHAQVSEAIARGARCVLGGTIPSGPGCFYPPTMLVDIAPGNPAASEEMFGPVAVVMRARDAEHAITLANATRFGLGCSLWSRDLDRAQRFAARIDAGAVFINGQVKSDVRLPFGGVKASGFGRELGLEGIRAFVNAKTVWIR
ncbi:MAG: aldehyde dehydrogenase family protein, partial [Planctomycetota bacterium]